eukprot:scaffold90099_cov35-Tisochrysis_lutea.AAC.3
MQVALAEIISLLGWNECMHGAVASDFGGEKMFHFVARPVGRSSDVSSYVHIPRTIDRLMHSATEGQLLLHNMLRFHPSARVTAEQALDESYFQQGASLIRASGKRHRSKAPSVASNASVEC